MKIELNRIIDFLTLRGWSEIKENEDNKYKYFKPPEERTMNPNYVLHLPKNENLKGYEEYILNIIRIISGIYKYDFDDLTTIIRNQSAVLTINIDEESIERGGILYENFRLMVDNFKEILKDAAGFVITDNIIYDKPPKGVLDYINSCNFLRVEKGSLTAKIELPSEKAIPYIPDDREIKGEDINEKLFDVLAFVTKDLLRRERAEVSDQFIESNAKTIQVNLLGNIQKFIVDSNFKNIKFDLNSESKKRVLTTKIEDVSQIENFKEFVRELKDKIKSGKPLDIVGQIIELYSLDPRTNRNYVFVKDVSGVKNVKDIEKQIQKKIKIILDANLYKKAIYAHQKGLDVHIKGVFREQITQFLLQRLDCFEVIEPRNE